MIWQNGQSNSLGTPFEQISAFVESEISSKQDKLADQQISAIDSLVDEQQTVVTYINGTTSAFYIVGELSANSIPSVQNTVNARIGSNVTSIGQEAF